MAADLKALHFKRGGTKQQLTLFEKYLTQLDEQTLTIDDYYNLKNRFEKIEPVLDNFYEIQSAIEYLVIDNVEEYEREFNERESFENQYFLLISKATRLQQNHMEPDRPIEITRPNSVNSVASQSGPKYGVKLPTISLPSFDGTFTMWRNFYDSFNALIHLNENLTDVQKLIYLKSSVKGEPHGLISTLETTELNYNIAYELLKKRYNNTRRIITNHVNAILNIQSITRDSPSQLRELINIIQSHVNCLRSLNQPVDEWNGLLVPIIISKLDTQTVREWESKLNNELNNTDNVPSLDELIRFLTCKQSTLEILIQKKFEPARGYCVKTNSPRTVCAAVNVTESKCGYCTKDHLLYQCEGFYALNAQARNSKVRELKVCINCLRKGHFLPDCKSTTVCRKCTKRHHTLLHLDRPLTIKSSQPPDGGNINNIELTSTDTTTHCSATNIDSQVLLATAIVLIKDSQNITHKIRVLLDSASQSNFITKDLASKLNLTQTTVNLNVTGIAKESVKITDAVNITFYSCHNDYSNNIKCLVIPNITKPIPPYSINQNTIQIPPNLKLADPTFNHSGPIDMLIGAGIFWTLLCIGQINQNNITIQKTKLGWILAGETINQSHVTHSISCLSIDNLSKTIERFWQMDEFISDNRRLTRNEIYCQNYFEASTKKQSDGRFIVKIPFKSTLNQIGNSYSIAESRLRSMEARFKRDNDLRIKYTEFINEYITLNHMTKIKNTDILNEASTFYLPHHCVFKNSSETTKLRVVFDGSCKLQKGLSLNEVQLIGPTLQDDIFSIIARFRLHKYVLTADIQKMYRQIWICPTERRYQRILWRENANNDISVYELNTVTYGTASAPYLAIRCLIQTALDNQAQYPIESEIIKNDFYVDDLITGSNDLNTLQSIKTNITNILKSSGFELHKFSSNIQELDEQNLDCLELITKEHKTLGVHWSPCTDYFTYSVNNCKSQVDVTKRTILSETAQLYDPLGLLAPIIIRAKLIIQQLWQLKLGWDESVPMNLYSQWIHLKNNLYLIHQIKIPRHVLIHDPETTELHIFSDASERAYGACVYLKSTNANKESIIMLLAAKSRVAPLKNITIPRLELSAAVLAAQLADKFKIILKIKINKEFYWCDSKVTLCWINSESNKWKTYVANRVAEIHRLSRPIDWNYVTSADNAADLITRGVAPQHLINNELWWNGPKWLRESHENYPIEKVFLNSQLSQDAEAKKITKTFTINVESTSFIQNYSSLLKLKRITAYCLRFKQNTLTPETKMLGPLTTVELNNALETLIRLVQINTFAEEYQTLRAERQLPSKCQLNSLTPWLDSNKLIRVGGRLKLSNFPFDKKHPILLPKNHHITRLIFKTEHETLLHAGPKLLLASIRERFWPIAGKTLAKQTVRQCVKCFKFDSKPIMQLMGNLPRERTLAMYPFHTTGVDYAGPYTIKEKLGRGTKTIKCYICLFICFSVKAIHLELVSDLTTKMFLLAFKRFIARRGKPMNMFSDNGTNFVGANNELNQLGEFLISNSDAIQNLITTEGVNWQFIPPRSPHFGGLWEAGVKNVKNHLKRIMSTHYLTFEEFSTLLAQIESILNSRPLTPLTTDPNDLDVLTPAHFLIGRKFTTMADPNVLDIPENRLTRYQMLNKLHMLFWKQWSRDYIQELQHRTKWQTARFDLKVGMLVIVKHDNLPPSRWHLGRITTLHPGSDNITRVVTIKSASGDNKVPVHKICVLPVNDFPNVN